ncbi:MAG: ribonuclease Y [Polyangiaceae bacterium UTPRO1]|jgi:ribonuclease Y|nr:ribonuclease Y [Myxococcales bacterium]OQY66284.1 MAG: ribonuclease Y [Polyangiaceae bacterium UTPRO1]
MTAALAFVFLGILLVLLMMLWRRFSKRERMRRLDEESRRIVDDAHRRSEALLEESRLKAEKLLLQVRTEHEQLVQKEKADLQAIEKRLLAREEAIDVRTVTLESRSADIGKQEQSLLDRKQELAAEAARVAELALQARMALEEVAGLTREEAKRALIEEVSAEAKREVARRVRLVEEQAREEADRRAKKIIAVAIERLAGEFVTERTVSVVHLPSDDMKGRIIGREGRNIRAIEAATGVDLIIDDTPEAVVVSCHSPIRREIARIALERLIADGRIHPGRIEELVDKAKLEVDERVREAGQHALFEVGIHGVHPELVRLLGLLKYRYSYAQNVLAHSVETAFICGMMAAELGINEKEAKRAALLHDIGKALSHEIEGSHAIIGADVARKYGESAKIVNAIAAHHEEVKAETILAPLVDAADAISGARPGARREVLESYVRRLEDLERISNAFRGVEKSFAVQAGREVRILVEPGKVSDDQAAALARDVARKIESEVTYPGHIKVTVIRELRTSDYAR